LSRSYSVLLLSFVAPLRVPQLFRTLHPSSEISKTFVDHLLGFDDSWCPIFDRDGEYDVSGSEWMNGRT
jgi:hypothetical protein